MSQVERLLERRVSVGSLCLLVLGSIGTAAVWQRAVGCSSEEDGLATPWWWILAAAVLILTQLGEVGFLWLFLCHVVVIPNGEENPVNGDDGNIQHRASAYNHDMAQELWAHRCRFACQCLSYTTCYTFGGRHAANHSAAPFFADVATALADFLESRNILDLTLTDWMAGLWVLQRMQRQRVYAARRRIVSAALASHSSCGSLRNSQQQQQLRQRNSREDPIQVGNTNDDDENALLSPRDDTRPAWYHLEASSILTLEELPMLDGCARYAKYALAMYTWVLYLYDKPFTGPGKLLWRGLMCGGRREQRIQHDNVWQAHKHGILLTAGVPEADLVYAQLESSFEDNPYCVILDHAWHSVVISVRGTFSLEDVITDTLVEPVCLEALGAECGFDGRQQYCHGGVLACARNVYRDLHQKGILTQLISGDDAPYPDYTLRLVGHSLGASAAALLSFMLRSQYPQLQCISYGPVGCTFTDEMAVACREWCVSCVLDADLVPRLSVDALRNLRDETLQLIGRIRVPKIELARRLADPQRCCQQLVCCRAPDEEDDDDVRRRLKDVLYEEDDVPTTDYHQQLERFSQVQSERLRQRTTVQLYPPGRILLLAKTGEAHTCFNTVSKLVTCCTISTGARYVPVWVDNDELHEIVVTPTMGTDHFPNRISAVLERVATDFHTESKRS